MKTVAPIIASNTLGSTASAEAWLTVVDLGWELADDFEPDRDWLQWSETRGLVLAPNFGGSVPPSNSLWFGGPVELMLTTRVLNTTNGGIISFCLRLGDSTAAFWDAPESPAEGVVFECALGPSAPWTTLLNFSTPVFKQWTNVALNIPIQAQGPAVRFRWRQLEHSGEGNDHWALDDGLILPESMPAAPLITAEPADQ